MSTNNASQTLFTFATNRNPELSDPTNKERRFIFRNYQTQQGIIDARVEAGETLQEVCKIPAGISIHTEESLKLLDPAFYTLAVWVARNKSTAPKAVFDSKINQYRMLHTQTIVIDFQIWDNLIYQTATQKDFYAKETIIQYLHLNHILQKYDGSNNEVYQDVIKAKVVLPKELFKKKTNTSIGLNASRMAAESKTEKVFYDDKELKFAQATIEHLANQNLLKTLTKLETTYKKEYKQAYDKSYTNHLKQVKPLQLEYQNSLKQVEAKKTVMEERVKYLSKLSLTNPELFEKNPELREELASLNKELLDLYIAPPNFPEFSFNFRPEIDPAYLERTLDEESKQSLYRIYGTNNITSVFDETSGFKDIIETVSENNEVVQQTILDNTILNEQVSTTVGGVVVPINGKTTNPDVITCKVFTYSPFYLMSYNHLMVTSDINVPRHIISGSYKLKNNNQEVIVSSSDVAPNQTINISSLFNNPTILNTQIARLQVLLLEGDVTLNDGLDYKLEAVISLTTNSSYKFQGYGTFTLKNKEPDTPTNPGNPGNPEEPNNPENPDNPSTPSATFIPSGFGMKNIGITDYLKVEQSVQGYIEGEVAHIENVMARERREKSTKKTSKSEITTMESSDSEKEQLRDTSSTDRFELQNEVAKLISEAKDANASAYVNGSNTYTGGSINYGAAGAFSTHNSKEENVRQAMTQAKEITQKATDKIITKVHKERTEKMIEEFEETNIHEFDNRKGNQHVVGVYRWVDKIYKNQIYNYGKRMMFEFMVPEPAKLHTLGMKISKTAENLLIKPVDPRESNVHKLDNFSSLSDEIKLKYWVSKYNVVIENEIKPEFTYVGKSFAFKATEVVDNRYERYGESFELEIDEDYETVSATAEWAESWDDPNYDTIRIIIGDRRIYRDTTDIFGFRKLVPISYSALGKLSGNLAVKINLKLSTEGKIKQRQALFNKIIAAYEKTKQQYDQDLASIQAQGVQIKGSNPGFYRQIENTILRRNCISYMINQSPSAALTFGKNKYYQTNNTEESFLNTEIKLDSTLDQYASFVKFMEQVFEWEIMSYYFYPYYWGNRNNWDKMYQFDDNDATFRAFMQSGMAKVIVTVRPGFEEAVRHFLATGQIWNGGEIPVIDDPLFLSIVDEMRKPEGEKLGKAWATRLPTALTILQAQSIGLTVTKALPFDDNLSDYEDPTKVPQSSEIVPNDAQMGGGETQKFGSLMGHIEGADGNEAKIVLKLEDGSNYTFTFSNPKGDWIIENIPVGKYELNIDAYNTFPQDQFIVTEGEKNTEVVINEKAVTEVNIVLKRI